MKKRDAKTFEKLLLSELSCIRGVKSLASVTLITFDVAIPTSVDTLNRLGQEPDGWKVITSKELDGFLGNFREVVGEDLASFMKDGRLGGSVFTTASSFLGMKPEMRAVIIAPIGEENGGRGLADNLTKVTNPARRRLQAELSKDLGGRILFQETVSRGITPIILSLYQDKGRSMALIRDDQEVKILKETLLGLEEPRLILVDARELFQSSYLNETINLARRPASFVVLGLGAHSVLPRLVDKIKILSGYTRGEMAFAGNRGEIEALLNSWGGVRNLSELMLETKLRFLLETDGQNGATLHFRVGNKVHSATYAIPKEEVFWGDTTNAGDIFLAVIIKGVMDEPYQGGSTEDWLYKILENASKGTLGALKERANPSKPRKKD